MFALLIPLAALIVYAGISAGQTFESLPAFVLLLALSPLMFWWAHMDRRGAEPLVRFLRDAVTVSGRSLRTISANVRLTRSFTLSVGGEDREEPATPGSIHEALLGLGAGDFVILSSAEESYIQTAARDGGYMIETREGSHLRHYRAIRQEPLSLSTDGSSSLFTFEEVLATFMAYASEEPTPKFLRWERMIISPEGKMGAEA
jgi:hypothetical protein